MEVGRILPTEAAVILNVSPQFIRIAMQQGKLPIGTAVQMSSIWTYHISVIYALSNFLIMILSWLVKQSLRAFLFQEVQP